MHVFDNEKHICLCHFPIAEWHGFYKGHWHIFGHYHNKTDGAFQYMKTLNRALNAGCMINNYTPASMNELIRNNQIFKDSIELSAPQENRGLKGVKILSADEMSTFF